MDLTTYRSRPVLFEDFLTSAGIGTTAGSGLFGLTRQTTGTGATSSNPAGTADEFGIGSADTGSDTTGYCHLRSAADGIQFNTGLTFTFEARVYLPDLSDGTNTYGVVVGFHDSTSLAPIDGAYFLYDSTTSANWQINNRSNSTGTATATSTAVVEDTWIKLKIIVTGAASVAYYINDTQVSGSPITTNIPTGTNRFTGVRTGIIKSAGTTSRSLYNGYWWMDVQYTTSR
jgi:hypothetical protein